MISANEMEHISQLTKKCENGDIAAMEALAAIYYEDHPEMMKGPAIPLVLDCYEKSAATGNQRSCLNLGSICFDGVYTQQDYTKAVELFKTAIQGQDARLSAIAAAKLGDCYFYGKGVDADIGKAFDCYLEGILYCNHPICLYKLGDMYRSGIFVKQDSKKAYFIYNKAKKESSMHFFNDGYAEILVRLAAAKIDGIGTEKDIQGAKKYLMMAQRMPYQSSHPENILPKIEILQKKI